MRPVDLLRAVAAGEVHQMSAGIGRRYQLNGEEISHMRLHWLKRAGWIELPLGGDPVITADGITWLKAQK